MDQHRIHNFNAGPAALPLPVLKEIQDEFLNFAGTGMSITEISHRSAPFDEIITDAVAGVKRLYGIGDDHHVLFPQGGASMQFAMAPMNFLKKGDTADYVNTGAWSTKAINEAQKLGKTVREAASSADRDFCYIPEISAFDPDAVYAHITSNNTIKGTQWAKFPYHAGATLVADMSSDMLSRPVDVSRFGLIYAGAQKNIGPAGVCLVIIRKDFLDKVPENLPTMLSYATYAKKNSMYNTPPCFAVYVVRKILKWLEETMGGLSVMEKRNREKAATLYQCIDDSDFYQGTADADSRSLMNVTFRMPDESLEKTFVSKALTAGFSGLKGHRSVGGCRASIYNATTLKAITDLIDFMDYFEKKNG